MTSQFAISNADTPADQRPVPTYLEQPEIIFKRIWGNPVDNGFLNLAD